MKTYDDFKLEVARKHCFKNWGNVLHLTNNRKLNKLINEASELYAEYKYKEGWDKGYNIGYSNALNSKLT